MFGYAIFHFHLWNFVGICFSFFSATFVQTINIKISWQDSFLIITLFKYLWEISKEKILCWRWSINHNNQKFYFQLKSNGYTFQWIIEIFSDCTIKFPCHIYHYMCVLHLCVFLAPHITSILKPSLKGVASSRKEWWQSRQTSERRTLKLPGKHWGESFTLCRWEEWNETSNNAKLSKKEAVEDGRRKTNLKKGTCKSWVV